MICCLHINLDRVASLLCWVFQSMNAVCFIWTRSNLLKYLFFNWYFVVFSILVLTCFVKFICKYFIFRAIINYVVTFYSHGHSSFIDIYNFCVNFDSYDNDELSSAVLIVFILCFFDSLGFFSIKILMICISFFYESAYLLFHSFIYSFIYYFIIYLLELLAICWKRVLKSR